MSKAFICLEAQIDTDDGSSFSVTEYVVSTPKDEHFIRDLNGALNSLLFGLIYNSTNNRHTTLDPESLSIRIREMNK
jgi:hypothetical protein